MTFVAWRAPIAVVGVLLGGLFLITGFIFEAAVTTSVTALWFLSHAGVPETLGVRFLHRQAGLEAAKLFAICVLLLADVAGLAVGFALRWNNDPEGPLL